MTQLDGQGQPINRAFNYSRNRDKAIYSLRGLLQGIIADQKLNESELLFFDAWLRSQDSLADNGDVVDLLNLIGDIIQDGLISSDELNELNDLINDVIEYGQAKPNSDEDKINELLGFLNGILADNKLNEDEFLTLKNWLDSNGHLADIFPVNILLPRIEKILEDGIIDEEELDDLLEVLKQITGVRHNETGEVDGAIAEVFSKSIYEFDHQGKNICFTGKFVSGNRKVCQKIAVAKGAEVKDKVTKKIDVLILGTVASKDWRFSSHGRKIESVLKLQKEGNDVLILSERTWLSFL